MKSATTVTFTLPEIFAPAIVPSLGELPLASGYATVSCDAPITALVLYSFNDNAGQTVAKATVFSSQAGTVGGYFFIGGRLGVAFANDSDDEVDCELNGAVVTLMEETIDGEATITIPPRQNVARFLDELVGLGMSTESPGGGFLVYSCESPVASIGLLFDGSVFTTLPATILAR